MVHVPALPPVPLTVRAAINQTYGSAKIVNVVHVRWNNAGASLTTAQLQTMLDGIANAWKTNMLPPLTTSLSMNSVDGRDLSSTTSPVATSVVTGAGAQSGGSDAANLACCVSWRIPRHYRGGHPRSYLGGIPTAARVSNQQFTGTFVGTIASAANAFIAAVHAISIASVNCDLVCVHYYSGRTLLAVPLVDVVSTASVNTRVDTQRRRLGK